MAIEAKTSEAEPTRRIRYGMIGGGQGAFIGGVHRIAARIDDQFELVCGALSSTRAKALESGRELGLPRVYGTYEEMFAKEAKLPAADRMQAVSIVTPNHVHFPAAKAAIEAGFHVICDKPLTSTLEDAKALAKLAAKAGKVFAVTHNYTGYPMVRQARAMVAAGELGDIRVVQVEYPQAWLSEALEKTGQKQAAWRTDPKRSGAGGSVGDIGTHAYNIACFVTGLSAESVLAETHSFVKGRKLDDNAHVLLRFKGGAKGMLWSSQVAPGNENALRLRVYGSKGGLEWAQEDPNYLHFTALGRPTVRFTRAGDGAWGEAARVTRIPSGHPEGYLEGFATIYAEAARAIRAHEAGAALDPAVHFPSVMDGLEGVRFIAAVVESSAKGNVWTKLP